MAGELEAALGRLFARPVKVTAAGRTDAGVHASAQVVSFVSHAAFPVHKLALALNSVLPADVSARDAARVDSSFSARRSALARHYAYTVLCRRMPSAVARRFAHHEWRPLDLDAMRAAAATLVGEHDFATFCGVPPEHGGTVRTLHAIHIDAQRPWPPPSEAPPRNASLGSGGSAVLRLRFAGAGFLHRMVRIMTGTLLEAGAGVRRPESIENLLAARDRRLAGPTAPARGLCLVNVVYPDFESQSGPAHAAGVESGSFVR